MLLIGLLFLQNGKANCAAKDDYIYMYFSEQHNPRDLALARVHKDWILEKSEYEYFTGIENNTPTWTSNMSKRGATMQFPTAGPGEKWMWASWSPSVVYYERLDVYMMTSNRVKDKTKEFWDGWCLYCPTAGNMGFWYAKHPWGSWKQIYYEDAFYPDDEANRSYGLKLCPKWISEDGKKMVLIWSDADNNHSTYYKWNQMGIEIITD